MNTLRWWNKWSRASATETFKVEDLDGNTIYVEIMYLLRTPEELWLGYNAHHQWMLSFVTTTFLSTRPPEYVLPPDKVCLSWWVWCVNVLVWYHPLQKLQILTMSKTMEWWPRTTKLLLLGRCTGVSLKCNGYNTLDLDFTTLQFEKIGNTFELPPNNDTGVYTTDPFCLIIEEIKLLCHYLEQLVPIMNLTEGGILERRWSKSPLNFPLASGIQKN